jgi:hypothetical protein
MTKPGRSFNHVWPAVVVVVVIVALIVGYHRWSVWEDHRRMAAVAHMSSTEARDAFVNEACLAPAEDRVHDNQAYCDALAARMTRQQKLNLYCGDPMVDDPVCDPLSQYP